MIRITSVIAACCLALGVTPIASAQVRQIADMNRLASSGSDGLPLPSRPLRTEMYAAVPGGDATVQACRLDTAPQEPEPDDSRWRWRLRAYRYLDCVMALVESASRTPLTEDTDDTSVRLSRADAERIRTLAWWARDAAARIGQ